MKAQMNRRNYNNNRIINAKAAQFKITRQNVFMAVMFSAYAFGVKAFGFLRNLVTVGSSPFDNLNRGQIRQMWYLQCMYRP